MKKLLIGLLFFLPSMAFASGIVQIDTTISNVNGGTLDYNGLNATQLVTQGGAYSKVGTPQFFIPAGSYQVIFTPPQGYTETNSANCTGTVADGETVHCQVNYTDGAAISFGSTQSQPPLVMAEPVTPVATSTPTGLTQPQRDAIIGILRAFGVDETTITLVATYL